MSVQGIRLQTVSLDDEIDLAYRLKAEAETAQARFEEQQAKVVKMLSYSNKKSAKSTQHKVTLVERTIPKYDEKGLAKALGATIWNKITKKSLDKVKLEKAVDEGEVDLNVVAQHTIIVPSKPYLRFSAVIPDAEE